MHDHLPNKFFLWIPPVEFTNWYPWITWEIYHEDSDSAPAISTEEVTVALSLSFPPTTWYNSVPFLTTHNKAVVLTSAQLTVKETRIREMKGDTKQI